MAAEHMRQTAAYLMEAELGSEGFTPDQLIALAQVHATLHLSETFRGSDGDPRDEGLPQSGSEASGRRGALADTVSVEGHEGLIALRFTAGVDNDVTPGRSFDVVAALEGPEAASVVEAMVTAMEVEGVESARRAHAGDGRSGVHGAGAGVQLGAERRVEGSVGNGADRGEGRRGEAEGEHVEGASADPRLVVACRARVSDACLDGSVDISEDGWRDDGTFDGESICCDRCYIKLMPFTPSGRGLTHELPAAIAKARRTVTP